MEFNTRIITRNDSTAKWLTNADQVLLKGEMAIEFTDNGTPKIKIGDGVTPWSSLGYYGETQFFEATVEGTATDLEAIAAVVGASKVKDGDFAVAKKEIAEGKMEYTAYIRMNDAWVALDGNYNAENIYFDEDLLTTSAVGNIKLTNGQATIAAKGKNLKQVFDTIFVKESNPTTTQPGVTIKSPEAKAYEVGSKVTPTYDATFSVGKYSYGPATGVTVTSWEVTDTMGNTAATEDGSFPEITVTDDTAYTITAKANYTDGVVPVTNTGNPYTTGQIKAGNKSATTSPAITGYRASFYGTLPEKSEVTSTIVRGLPTKSEEALVNGSTFEFEVPVGALRVVIAFPATLQDVSSIADKNGLGAEIKTSFSKSIVTVEGANGFNGIEYKVYTIDYANANDTANTYIVTI